MSWIDRVSMEMMKAFEANDRIVDGGKAKKSLEGVGP